MSAGAPHLLHVFSTFVPAGPELRFVRLANALGREFRHSVLAVDGRTDAEELLDPGLDVELLPALPRAGTPATVRRLLRLLGEIRPDAVCSYNFGAMDAAIAARIARGQRLLHHEDGFNADEAEGYKRRREWLRRAVLPGAHRVVVPSAVLERVALERWGLPRRLVELVPNGIRTEDFPARDGNAELRDELGIPRDAFLVGFVGHLRPVKRPDRLLDACARLPRERGTHLLVLGDGALREDLARRASEGPLAGRVHLAGHRADPRPFYRAMDAFALVSDSEQMPVALLEAMASSLAVVATDVGDVRRMLPEEQHELCVPLGDDVALRLATGLDALAGDVALRDALGAANAVRVRERYDFGAMLAAHRALWLGTVGRA